MKHFLANYIIFCAAAKWNSRTSAIPHPTLDVSLTSLYLEWNIAQKLITEIFLVLTGLNCFSSPSLLANNMSQILKGRFCRESFSIPTSSLCPWVTRLEVSFKKKSQALKHVLSLWIKALIDDIAENVLYSMAEKKKQSFIILISCFCHRCNKASEESRNSGS